MAYTIEELAVALGGAAHGAVSFEVDGLAEPASARAGDLALASNPDYADALSTGAARAALLWEGADWAALGLKAAITVGRPRYAMSELTRLFDAAWEGTLAFPEGRHPTVLIAPTAEVAP
ncbi:MAG: LpxD N-terminal domain-containing protein, partial [Pseudomonadota bacterium]